MSHARFSRFNTVARSDYGKSSLQKLLRKRNNANKLNANADFGSGRRKSFWAIAPGPLCVGDTPTTFVQGNGIN